jgi:excisionase family DNA binding protein
MLYERPLTVVQDREIQHGGGSTMPPEFSGAGAARDSLLDLVYLVLRKAVRDGMADALQSSGEPRQGKGRYLTPREAADVLRIHPYTVYEMVKQGKLRSVRVGRRILIPESAVKEFEGADGSA